jgi:hypothetical protein
VQSVCAIKLRLDLVAVPENQAAIVPHDKIARTRQQDRPHGTAVARPCQVGGALPHPHLNIAQETSADQLLSVLRVGEAGGAEFVYACQYMIRRVSCH